MTRAKPLLATLAATVGLAAPWTAEARPAPDPQVRQAEAPDPIEGRWWGTVAAAHETVELGLEIRRGAEGGGFEATLTQPGANYFNLALPGVLRREGEQVQLAEMGLRAILAGDRLSGTFGRAQVPIDLRRVIELDKPALRVTYRLEELGEPTIASLLVERGIIDS